MQFSHATVEVGCGCVRGMEITPYRFVRFPVNDMGEMGGTWKSFPSPGTYM